MSADDERIRVLYVAPGLGTGGAERSAVDLAGPLSARGIDLTFCVQSTRAVGAQSDVGGQGLLVSDATSLVGWARDIRATVKARNPHVVHTTLFQADMAGRLACVFLPVPVLSSIVNMSYEPARKLDPAVRAWKLEVTRWAESVTGRLLTDRFHAITHATQHAAVERLHFDSNKITVVPRARDLRRLGGFSADRRQRARQTLGIGDEELVMTVGRQEYQKGHDDLIHAIAHVRRTRPGVQLAIVGREGGQSRHLREIESSLDFEPGVIWLGHRADVTDLMCAADVFAFPSRFEGLGGVLLEAMHLRLPIVASAIPPVREVLDGVDAELCDVGSVADLARGISTMLEHPERRQRIRSMSAASLDERYSMDRVADEMATLYRSVASTKR